jgi:tetratricopeptide (TPR) repeat protein
MRRTLCLFIVAASLLSGCSLLKGWMAEPAGRVEKPGSRPSKAESRSKEKLEALLRARDYGGAVSIIRERVKAGRSELSYRSEYAASINGLAAEGIRHLESMDYLAAGTSFRKALENYPKTPAVQAKITYPAGTLDANLKECSKKLMEEGLIKYRDGALEEAVSAWKKILRFDPEHAEAQKSIETATVQLKRLKTME